MGALLAVFLAVFLGGQRAASAATRTWDAGGDGTSWSDADNWSNNDTPDNNDTAIINSGTVILDQNTPTLVALTINGGSLTANAGRSINVNGILTVAGGSFTGSSGAVNVDGITATSGSFTGGSGTITVNGSVAISSTANFTGGSGAKSVSGSFTKTGTGTFTNTGTVSLTGSGNVANSTGSFAGLTVASSGTYTANGALSATGTFTMTSGTFTSGANAVSVGPFSQGGGAFNASSGTMTVSGSFTRTGGTFAANGGTVQLTGSGTISTNGGSLNALTIAAGSGTYTLGGAVTTASTFTMTSGTLTAGANAISVGGSFIQTGGAFTAPSGTMTVTGAFDRTGGTFTAGSTLTLNSIGTVSHRFGGATLGKVIIGQESGMVGYWRLDEASGAAIADSSGYGNGGNLVGGFGRTTPPAALTSSVNAVTFDGTAYSILGVTGIPANDAVQSISCWVNLSSNAGIQNFVTLINGASASAVQVGIRNPNLVAWKYNGTALATASLPTINGWHHVVYTFDGTTHRIYLDGSAGTSSTTAPQTATPTQTYLGSYDGVNEFLLGALDDVRVYNRLLSAADVTTLRNGGNPSPGAGGTHTFLDAFVATGDFVIGTGTVTGTFPLTVGGDWLNTGGTFTGTGLVTMNGTGSAGVVLANGSQFGALTVSGSGGTYMLSDAIVATGAFTVASGSTVTGASTMSVGGDWNNSGVFLGTGAVTLTGASGSYILKSNGGRFSSLTLNGSGGTYTLQDRLSVPGGTVTLTAGTLAGGANTARVGRFSVGSGSFTYGATGTLIIDDASNQTLPFASYGGSLRLEDRTESNLLAYWKLDAGNGTQVYDFTGNGNNGSLSATGVTWQAAATASFGFDNPASVAFNGSTGTASIPAVTLPAHGAAQAVSFWMNPTSMSGTQNMVVLANATAGVQIGIRSGTIGVWAYPNVATNLITGPAVTTSAWHHVVYTYDGAGNQSLTVDGVRTTATATNPTGSPSYAYLGTYSPNNGLYTGGLDEVRIYNAALTTAQIAQLFAGRYAGTGGIATYTLGGNTTVGGQLFVDDAILDANTRTMSVAGATAAAQVNTGSYLVGSNTQTFAGGLTVTGGGTLTLTSSGAAVAIGNGKTFTVDGTLNASSTGAAIRVDTSGSYAFKVGSTASARPTVNITGLAVQNTDINGMWINTVSGAATTFTHFDSIAFNNGTAGAGSQYLQVSATSLYLTSSAASFGVGEAAGTLPAVSVKLTGNGTTDGETRIVFGGATCATTQTDATTGLCVTTWKTDDDPNGDGVGNTPATNGAVVQFSRSATTDIVGTIEGFPVAAFDWNTFAHYSTYATFHDVSGTVDRIYARTQTGAAKYSWDTGSGETIVGGPRYATVGTTHYVYVATNGATADTGKIYRLKDDGASLAPDSSGNWTGRNPFTGCSCTITTPLGLDATNLYWGGTTGGAQRAWRLAQALAATSPFGLPVPVSITPTITSAAPAQLTAAGITYMLLGLTGHVLKVDMTNMMLAADNSSPGAASVFGRIGVASPKVFAGDDGGTMWALDFNNFAGTTKLWSYTVAGSDPIKSSAFYDFTNAVLMFGTEGGKVVALNSSGTPLPNYPYTPGTATDSVRSALLYIGGILAVGTTTGKLFFIDRSQGSAAGGLVREYYFGPTESVSGIGYDASVSRYMVTTADPTVKDGRLYYIDLIADPTPGAP